MLIPFFTAGYPSVSSIADYIHALNDIGSDYIEIGLGHSDALADGPVIQQSSQIALQNGINIHALIAEIATITSEANISSKLILFSYINPILTYGIERTVSEWAAAGGYAILVPDLPLNESQVLHNACQKYHIHLIYLIAPTSTLERIEQTVAASTDFIYIVSSTGVTGAKNTDNRDLSDIIAHIKALKPSQKTVIGFGIDGAQKAKQAMDMGADGVVVGSAIVRLVADNDSYISETKALLQSIMSVVK